MVAQSIDGVLFFSTAFIGNLPTTQVFEIMIAGYLLKIIAGLIGAPFLHLSRMLKKT